MSLPEPDILSKGVNDIVLDNISATVAVVGDTRIEDDDDESDQRVMNDSTMPPPRKQLQNTSRSQQTQRTTAEPSGNTTGTAVPRQRKKVGRFGLSDWTRLVAVSNDLAQRKGRPIQSKIQWKEIKKHNSVHDGWMVIKGKVYNITPYLPYHPGGEKILKSSLGRDGTVLYEKYHRWVNEDGLIGKLLLGNLDKNSKYDSDDDSDSDDDHATSYMIPSAVASTSTNSNTITANSAFAAPAPRNK